MPSDGRRTLLRRQAGQVAGRSDPVTIPAMVAAPDEHPHLEVRHVEHLVVDDTRTLDVAGAVHARSSAAALTVLAGRPTVGTLWLDHDLGGDDRAVTVVTWLAEQAAAGTPIEIGEVIVHSMNATADSMARTVARWGYRVRRIPAHLIGELRHDPALEHPAPS